MLLSYSDFSSANIEQMFSHYILLLIFFVVQPLPSLDF